MIAEIKKVDKELQEQRDKVDEFEHVLGSIPGAVHGNSPEFPLNHLFGGGIYCREILLPAGSTCVGKLHKTKHPNFIMRGRCIVTTNMVDDPIEIVAPAYFFSDIGTKKVVHAIEDTVWVTVHATEETDVEIIEDQLVAKSYDEIDAIKQKELT
jgi:hypothetical protein